MKRVFIIHRWSGGPQDDWRPWLSKELRSRGYEVFVPEMPETDNPQIEKWVAKIAEVIGVPDENTCFVGHSIGCQAIMRYLQTLPAGNNVAMAVFVAGWFNLAGLDAEGVEVVSIARPWIETPIEYENVKKACSNINVFLSANEPYGYIEHNKEVFENKLNAHVTILPSRGHFTEDDGVTELPEVLELF